MTKAEIISFVANNLKKIDKTNKYHPIVLEKAITLAFNQGYGDVFDQDPRLLDNFTKTYNTVAVAADGTIYFVYCLTISIDNGALLTIYPFGTLI